MWWVMSIFANTVERVLRNRCGGMFIAAPIWWKEFSVTDLVENISVSPSAVERSEC